MNRIMAVSKEDIQSIYVHAKAMDLSISHVIVSPAMESTVCKIIEQQNLPLKVTVSPRIPIWNLDAYKAQVLKYDGNAKPITIGEVWDTISRHNRRMIERQVKKGKNPDIIDYL